MKLQGNNTHRHADNPLEKQLHDSFIREYVEEYKSLELIVLPSLELDYQNHNLSDRERVICISLIQWLGSPVGQYFLRSNGFQYKPL